MRSITLLLALACAGSGCNTAGPAAIRSGQVAYNVAVQQSADEQLVLNLVRLRYRDTLTFLDVTSVSTSFELATSASLGASLFPNSNDDELGAGVGIVFSEKPTITYLPLRGENYVRQMLTPLDMGTMALLANTGWRPDRILSLCAQRLGDALNAPTASGPTPDAAPEYQAYFDALDALGDLYRAKALDVRLGQAGERSLLVVDVAPGADEAAAARFAEALGVAPAERYIFAEEPGPGELRITTRSPMGIMFYLSHAVQAPPAHTEAGLVTTTRTSEGEAFDWDLVSGRFLRVHAAKDRPQRASVAVQRRGAWYYIADDDLNSKSTFQLLRQIIALQASEIESAAPLLTLPVG